jgi:hypothetical protein
MQLPAIVCITAFAIAAGSANAQCPAVGADTTCGTIITITDAGATVSFTGQGPFDGNDDTLVGIVNNSSRPVSTLRLSGPLAIFAFDGDGMDTFGIPGNPMDDTTYGGPNAYYTDINDAMTAGTVHFIVPIAAGGGTGYFSLEAEMNDATTCAQIINNALSGPTGIGAPTVSASFTPNQGLDLYTAATYCGFAFFDWQQTITSLPSPSPFFQVGNTTALVAPPSFLDPPPGGYDYESAQYPDGDQSYPFYYDPNSGELDGQNDGYTLSFSDTPADRCLPGGNSAGVKGCNGSNAPAGSFLGFTTHLAGVNMDGTATDLGIGFTWTSTFNGTSGGTSTTKNALPPDPGGTGGVTVTSVNQITTYTYNAVTVGGVNALQFVPVTPCRIMDTRNGGFASGFGPPFIAGGSTRTVQVLSSACNIPAAAQAYALNMTVIPRAGTLAYLSVWPTGQPQPLVSTLNSIDGAILANAAIVPGGTNGAISIFVTNDADVVTDINGYFAAPASNTLQFYTLAPCRVLDTRNAPGNFGAPAIAGGSSRSFAIPSSPCGVPTGAAAYSLNVTVVPHGGLGYLTVWPTGQAQPVVSTLNSADGTILANAAIVPAGTNGAASFFASNTTDLVVDINGYFASPGTGGLNFYNATPCRLVDTRSATGPLGGPVMNSGTSRAFPLPTSTCGLPATASAYSLNTTVVPEGQLAYLTLWPTGEVQPFVSTLNALDGQIVANAALVPAGTQGSVDVFVFNTTHVIIDTNGYFGQ